MMEHMNSDQVKRAAAGMKKAQLEQRFLEAWRRLFPSLPRPVAQHRFHPKRKWLWDFAWPEQKVACEIQGGSWIRGRHNTATGQQQDCEKQRAAVALGWRMLPFNSLDMQDPDYCAECVAEVLTNAVEITSRAAI